MEERKGISKLEPEMKFTIKKNGRKFHVVDAESVNNSEITALRSMDSTGTWQYSASPTEYSVEGLGMESYFRHLPGLQFMAAGIGNS